MLIGSTGANPIKRRARSIVEIAVALTARKPPVVQVCPALAPMGLFGELLGSAAGVGAVMHLSELLDDLDSCSKRIAHDHGSAVRASQRAGEYHPDARADKQCRLIVGLAYSRLSER